MTGGTRRMLLLPMATLIACSGSGGDQSDFMRDAGFPILEAREITRTDSTASFVEVTDAALDSQGRLYVGDFYLGSVQVFSPDGVLLRTVGSRGPGPGEFRQLRNVQVVAGDTLLVYDSGKGALTAFGPDSSSLIAVETVGRRAGAPPRELEVVESDVRGYFALFEEWDSADRSLDERLAFIDTAGSVVRDSLAFGPKHPIVRVEVAGRQYRIPHPFRTGVLIAAHRSGLYATVSDSRGATISMRSVTDPTVAEYRTPHDPPQVSATDREAFVNSVPLDWARPAVRAEIGDYGGDWPVVDRATFDADARLWVRLGDRPSKRRLWIVLNSQKADPVFGTMLPADADVVEAQGSTVYLAQEDDQGRRYVSTVSLSRGSGDQ